MPRRTESRTVDYEAAFRDSPVGQAIATDRVIRACNRAFTSTFGGTEVDFVGRSFGQLYPTQTHFESTGDRVGPILARDLTFADHRVMRRLGGELFWVHVRGYTYTPGEPHRETIWVFTELHSREGGARTIQSSLTARERDVATLLIEGKTGKEIGLALGISPRTVDIYKAKLLRKYEVTNTPDLVRRLLTG